MNRQIARGTIIAVSVITYQVACPWCVRCFGIEAQVIIPARILGLSGQPAPGYPNRTFRDFGAVVVNSHGHAVISAMIDLGGGNRPWGLWTDEGGELRKVAVTGEPVLGYSVATVGDFWNIRLNDRGDVAFATSVSGGSDTSASIVATLPHGASNYVTLAAGGDPVPQSSERFGELSELQINSEGDIAFFSSYPPAENGVFVVSSVGVERLLASNSPAPDLLGLEIRYSGAPSMNDRQQFILAGRLKTSVGGVTDLNDSGIWIGTPDHLNLLVREGDEAANAPGWFYDIFPSTRLNGVGQYAVYAGLRDSQNVAQTMNSPVLYVGDEDGMQLIVSPKQTAPGTNGLRFVSFQGATGTGSPLINSEGEVAFLARLTDGNLPVSYDYGIFSSTFGDLHLVARVGESAPETEGVFSKLDYPQMNGRGTVVFRGSLAQSGSTNSSNDEAIWAECSDGIVRLILREGDWIEIAPGDRRHITRLGQYWERSGGEDGITDSLGENDALGLSIMFSDGTAGAFLIHIVPEPSTIVLACIAIVIACACFRRRENGRGAHLFRASPES